MHYNACRQPLVSTRANAKTGRSGGGRPGVDVADTQRRSRRIETQDDLGGRDFATVATALLGGIERFVRLREKFGHVERPLLADRDADTAGRANRTAVDLGCSLRERSPDCFRDLLRTRAIDVIERDREFFATQ